MKNRVISRKRSRLGFTLMEVLLVLVILVVLAGFAIQNMMGTLESANKKIAKTAIGMLTTSVKEYQLQVGSLPQDLNALYEQPSDIDASIWVQKLDKPVPMDPWNRPFEYKLNGSSFEIRSVGPDGQSGSTDDITM
ncbi:MAG: type II secretion system protein GspG [Pirellula sp.]